MVEMSAQHMYRIILFGTWYGGVGRCDPDDGFLSIGRCESYDPEVSLDEPGDEAYEEYSESSSESSDCLYFSSSTCLEWCIGSSEYCE